MIATQAYFTNKHVIIGTSPPTVQVAQLKVLFTLSSTIDPLELSPCLRMWNGLHHSSVANVTVCNIHVQGLKDNWS